MATGEAHPPPVAPPKRKRTVSIGDRIRTTGRGAERRRIQQLLEAAPTDHLLDVGGGTGAFTLRFADSLAEVVVLEPNNLVARVGAGRHLTLRFVTGPGETIPFPDGSFHRLTAIRSTHHMDSPERFFAEAHRVLSPGGRIVIEEMGPGSLLARLFNRLGRRCHHPGLDFRGPAEWEAGLSRAGFDEVHVLLERRWFFLTGRKDGTGSPTA